VEGTRDSILLLTDQADYAEEVYRVVRDNPCYDLKVIKVDKRIDPNIFLRSNSVSVLLFCVRETEYFTKTIKEIQTLGYDFPIIPITKLKTSEITHLVKDVGCHEPLFVDTLNDCVVLQAIFSSIERKKISHEIRMRDTILRSVNFAAEKFLNNPNWKMHIKDVLEKIAGASRVDRVYLFENINTNGNISTARLVERWVASGISDELIAVPGEERTFERLGIAPFVQELRESRFIKSHVRDLPKKIQPLYRLVNIKSILIVSIFINGDWWGFIGFDQCKYERNWETLEIEELKTAASILSAAISRQKTDARLKYLATHDYLTNLPNRLLFEDHFHGAMARSQRSKKWTGLFVIDLDHFKKVNDTYGHPFGDKVLIEVGKRLQESIRASDTVARIGGDEFVIIGEELTAMDDVCRVGEKILSAFKEPVLCDNNKVQISPSIGISIYPNDSEDMEKLMHFADIGLYRAKKQGNTFNVYEEDTGKQLWLGNLQRY
jgi:diguanylate cyclase (GGDEF)-like protein